MGTALEADVVVVGSSITGWMAAAWLARKAGLRVVVVGPEMEAEKRPIVGESTVEPAVLFFRDLGLDAFDQGHAVKHGLSFHHKLRPGDPADSRYSVHAPERHLAHESRQLHRPRFDAELAANAMASGAVKLVGVARAHEQTAESLRHRLTVSTPEGNRVVAARWIIDASGRKRVLGKELTRYRRPERDQRCVFWFRLADFEPFMEHFDAHCRRPLDYDLWYTTHHFMGHGHWIWGIPLQSGEHRNLISVGITWHPGVMAEPVRSMDDFLAHCDVHHPPVARMVRSGTVLDQHRYMDYLYAAERVYSPDGWFLLGDAARTVDPLYSTGLSMTSVQVLQVASMIRLEREGSLTAADVEALEGIWTRVADRRQVDIASQYATMGDPWCAHLRRYWNLNQWFNGFLPLWFNGFITEPAAARFLLELAGEDRPEMEAWFELLAKAGARLGPIEHAHLDASFDFDRLLDRRFDCPRDVALDHMARMFRVRALMRLRMLQIAGGADAPRQLGIAMRELLRSVALPLIARRRAASLIAGLRRPFALEPEPVRPRGAWRDLALLLSPQLADRMRATRVGRWLSASSGA